MLSRRRRRGLIPPLVLLFIVLSFIVFTPSEGPRSNFHSSRRKLQHSFHSGFRRRSYAQPGRLAAVKAEFLHAWDSYQDHGRNADELGPLTGAISNKFCGWSATLVDALDTLFIMGLKDEFAEAVEATTKINYNATDNDCIVNLFETVIRHLGGLIAAYDLSQEAALLPKMKELGDLLHSSFNTFNGLPCSHCNLMVQPGSEYQPPEHIAMAAQGSLHLEFTRLSQILGDEKYYLSVMNVTQAFARIQMNSTIPGLWPETISANDEDGFDPIGSLQYSLGALSDSSYEYLVKGHLMAGYLTDQYATMWARAAPAIREHLIFRPHVPGNWDILLSGTATCYSEEFKVTLDPKVQHLACFQGGMFALAAKIFNEPADFLTAQRLTDGCVWAYNSTVTGIMPEAFLVDVCDDKDDCIWDATLWETTATMLSRSYGLQHMDNTLPEGFLQVADTRYLLRPEAIESVFYMFRMTGDEYWREVGWDMFNTIVTLTRAPFGHAAVENVMLEEVELRDEMESFWFAETLKYFYLLFSDPRLVSLDEYVLNTEAHPFKLVKGSRGY